MAENDTRRSTVSLPLASGAVIAGLVSIGTLIESIFGSLTGFHEFATIQSRNVLVGLCFAVFLAAPTGVVLLTLAAYRKLPIEVMAEHRWAGIELGRAIPAAATFLALIWLVPLPLHYFLPHAQIRGNDIALFWSSYLNMHWDVVFVIGTVLIVSDIVLIRFGQRGLTFGRVNSGMLYLCTFAVIMIAGTLFTYSRFVYTNVPYSMGGGAPRIVFLEFDEDTIVEWASDDYLPAPRFRELLMPPEHLSKEQRERLDVLNEILVAQAPERSRGPFLLWRENRDFIFITDPNAPIGFFRSGISIRKDQVLAISESGVTARFGPRGFRVFDSWGVRAKWLDTHVSRFTEEFRKTLQETRDSLEQAQESSGESEQ